MPTPPPQQVITGPEFSETGSYTLNWSIDCSQIPSPWVRLYENDWVVVDFASCEDSHSFSGQAPGVYEYEVWVCFHAFSTVCVGGPDAGYLPHTVEVTETLPPSEDFPHVVRQGDLHGNGLTDFAVVAQDPTQRLLDDFIVQQVSPGEFEVLENASASQIADARQWALSGARAVLGDYTLNASMDVLLHNVDSVVAGANDMLLLNANGTSVDFPTLVRPIDADFEAFLSEASSALSEPDYLDTALTEECVTQSGWYTGVFFLLPGIYHDPWDNPVEITEPGFYFMIVFLDTNQCFEVIDSSVVDSNIGFHFGHAMIRAAETEDPDERNQHVNLARLAYETFLGTTVGVEGLEGPADDHDRSLARAALAHWSITLIRDAIEVADALEDEVGLTQKLASNCVREASPLERFNPQNYFAPTVAPPASGVYTETAAQIQFIANQDRLGYWQSRLNDSGDPLGPLAIDIVEDNYFLGCMANRRLEAKGARFNVEVDLEEVGIDLIQRHSAAIADDTETPPFGKLSADTIADYHFDEFSDRSLPNRTFGGAPLTGTTREARLTRWTWCPSCPLRE